MKPKVILSDSIKKTRLRRALAKAKPLVALMLEESIKPKVILSDSIKKTRLSPSLGEGKAVSCTYAGGKYETEGYNFLTI